MLGDVYGDDAPEADAAPGTALDGTADDGEHLVQWVPERPAPERSMLSDLAAGPAWTGPPPIEPVDVIPVPADPAPAADAVPGITIEVRWQRSDDDILPGRGGRRRLRLRR